MTFLHRKKKVFLAALGALLIIGFVLRVAYAEFYDSCGSVGSFFYLSWQEPGCSASYPNPAQPDFVSNSNDVTISNDGVQLTSPLELGVDDTLNIEAQSFITYPDSGGTLTINGGTLTISNGGNLVIQNDNNDLTGGLRYQVGTFQVTYGSITNHDPSYLSFTEQSLPYTPSQQTSNQGVNFNVLSLATNTWQFSGDYPSELAIDSMTGTISLASDVVGDETGILYVNGTVSGGYATQAISYSLDDATAPSTLSVHASSDTYGIGDTVYISLSFSEPVSISGVTPSLALSNGETATFSSGSGSDTWVFAYTVEAGDGASFDLDVTDAVVGTDVQDTGNNGVSNLSMPGSPNTLAESANVVIDASGPQISSITSDAADANYGDGETINVQVTFVEPISATGNATLSFNSGGTSAIASLIDGDTVTFPYTVVSGESTSDLDVTAINNYEQVADAAGNVMDAGTLPVDQQYTLAGTKNITINVSPVDASGPVVQSIAPATGDGTYGVGEQILFDILFDENVYVSGSPVVSLNSGGTADFVSVSGDTIRFSYVVGAGESSNDLDIDSANALSLNGGSIKDVSDNDAVLTLPDPGQAGSLGANANIVIDTTVVENENSGSGGGRRNTPTASRPSDENLSLTITALTGTSVNVAGAHIPDVIVTDSFGYEYKEVSASNWNTFTERTDVKTEARFSRMVDTLVCDTTYVFRAFAKNRIGMTHSDFITVTTPVCDASAEKLAEVESPTKSSMQTPNTNQLPTVTRVLVCPIFETLLAPGDTDPEVPRLKVFLNFLFPDLRLNIQSLQYDDEAQVGVKRFQKMYESTILAPLSLVEPTGWWYQSSIDQANTLLGCE